MNTDNLADRRRGSPSGEEELRFIRNFHDVFLSIGLMLFGAGLGLVSMLLVGQTFSFQSIANIQSAGWSVAIVFFVDAAIMWLTAEFFARSRRLFLPAIVILIGFVWFFTWGVIAAYITAFSDGNYSSFDAAARELERLPLTVSATVTFAIFLYYFRMKLPFAMGLGAVGLVITIIAFLGFTDGNLLAALSGRLQLFSGLFLFLLGVYFDARDPARVTRLSDNGFWLHFFAAPLIFNAVMTMTTGGGLFGGNPFANGGNATGQAGLTLGLVIFFAVVSLLINRRALLVAGLLSAAASIAALLRASGLGGAWIAGMTLLLLGGAMVLLGGGWHGVRRALVAPFPKTGLIARIIPPEPEPGEAVEDR